MTNDAFLIKPRKALNKAFLKVMPNRDEIEKTKEIFAQNGISLFETQIDQLVYELYSLSEEEIGIVEGCE